jgi:hypothetical protein
VPDEVMMKESDPAGRLSLSVTKPGTDSAKQVLERVAEVLAVIDGPGRPVECKSLTLKE